MDGHVKIRTQLVAYQRVILFLLSVVLIDKCFCRLLKIWVIKSEFTKSGIGLNNQEIWFFEYFWKICRKLVNLTFIRHYLFKCFHLALLNGHHFKRISLVKHSVPKQQFFLSGCCEHKPRTHFSSASLFLWGFF